MSILITFIPNFIKSCWKSFSKDRGIKTSELVAKFLEAYMTPLGTDLQKILNLKPRCSKCCNLCGLIIKDYNGEREYYSECCGSDIQYVDGGVE